MRGGLVALVFVMVGCANEAPVNAVPMERVTYTTGVATYAVPSDWERHVEPKGAVQYFPKGEAIVMRVSILEYTIEKAESARAIFDKTVAPDADTTGETAAGDPWSRQRQTDADGPWDTWYILWAKENELRTVVLTVTMDGDLESQEVRAGLAVVEKTVDSFVFAD